MIANLNAIIRETKESLASLMRFATPQLTLKAANARLALIEAHTRELIAEIEETEGRIEA